MSLDVYLYDDFRQYSTSTINSGIFIREDGAIKEISREEWDARFPWREPIMATLEGGSPCVYHADITHNLGKMAVEAGIYNHIWRAKEYRIDMAHQLIYRLEKGLAELRADPDYYSRFNPENGWGSYDGLTQFVESYLNACREFPLARVEVSR